MAKYSIGLDFGTLSVRGVLVDIDTGEIAKTSVFSYPHGVMKQLPDGKELPKESAYAHPADYMEGMQKVVAGLTKDNPEVVAIGIDATSCSVIPLAANGSPLCFKSEFADREHAYIKLWKHHCATEQARHLFDVAKERGERFLSDSGNTINAESFFPKALETFEEDREVFAATALFMDVGEWLTMMLTGKLTVSQPLACFKRLYHPFRGYPAREYFETVATGFSAVLDKLKGKLIPVGGQAGTLHPRSAALLGLPEGIAVAPAQIDAHTAVAAVGGRSGDMVCVMGTSGVSLMCSHSDSGMDGVYTSSAHTFLPDTYGQEGGQSAVGDSFGWFADNCVPPEYHDRAMEKEMNLQAYLSELAGELQAGESGLLALNWTGGVRTPLADYSLTANVLGLTLTTKPEEIYRALLEGSIYGARRIRDIYANHGHTITRVFLGGGIPRKNALFCQLFADILGCEVQVCSIEDSCALGSAILAAMATGERKSEDVLDAMRHRQMTSYYPDFKARETYDKLYAQYLRLSDMMSGYDSPMRKVKKIKEEI